MCTTLTGGGRASFYVVQADVAVHEEEEEEKEEKGRQTNAQAYL